MESFTSKQVAKITSTPYRTLMFWVETGLIHPQSYAKRRRPTVFSRKDLEELKLLKTLRRHLSGQALRRAIEYLRGIGQNALSTGKFLVIGKDLVKICGKDEKLPISLIKEAGQLLILDCLELKKEYRKV